MKKSNAVKGSLSHHPLLPTGILMTVWRHPAAIDEIDTSFLPPELEEYLHAVSHELDDMRKHLARLETRLARIEEKLKRLPKISKRKKLV